MDFNNVSIFGGIELQVAFPPGAPIMGTATAWETAATITFTAPASNGSTSIISYTATSSPGNITSTVYQSGSGAVTVTGLSPSTSYTFTITATNSNGTSLPSAASNSITTVSASIDLYSFGVNDQGQLGQNDVVYRSSPTQVGSTSTWNYLTSGRDHILATKRDGTLWGWGRGLNGQLGLNDVVTRSSPTQIGALTNWSVISAGYYGSYGIKTDGTLWAWGNNNNGQLGIGTVVAKSSPVIIGSANDWADVSAGDTGIVIALKTNGTIWTWGLNTNGCLGLNDTVSRSSPSLVGTGTDWEYISANGSYMLATKTDGTLWAWGTNPNGQLGLNDLVHRSSPVQVGSLTTWNRLVKGGYSNGTGFAIKTDGTMWGWGSNSGGRIGINSTANRSSPVQIGSDTTWSIIASGYQNASSGPAVAIKTNGTIWTWGQNANGGLGFNDLVSRSSPTQLGSATDWISSPTAGFSGGTVAMRGTVTVPSAPVIRTVYLVSSTSVAVEYLPPITDGGSPITSYTAMSNPGYIQNSVSRANGGVIVVSGLTLGASYTFTVTATNSNGTSVASAASDSITTSDAVGQAAYTTAGTYSWVAPEGVRSVCVVAVGGGGCGFSSATAAAEASAGGGGLGWKNNIPVTPGQSYTVVVGLGGRQSSLDGSTTNGQDSYFITANSNSYATGKGGISGTSSTAGTGGSFYGDGGGSGGNGVVNINGATNIGGGGAGGYLGNGGNATSASSSQGNPAATGSGGGGGGGDNGNGGGGVGIYGRGADGGEYGGGGSGGGNGGFYGASGAYGGGGGTHYNQFYVNPAGGAVRIIWGPNRAFPSTNTADM